MSAEGRAQAMADALDALPNARQFVRPIVDAPKRRHATPWWWGHAMARVGRLLEMATATSDIAEAHKNTECPALALEISRHWAAYQVRRPWKEPTLARMYDGLSDIDAARKLIRFIEDVCERSKKVPGLREWRYR